MFARWLREVATTVYAVIVYVPEGPVFMLERERYESEVYVGWVYLFSISRTMLLTRLGAEGCLGSETNQMVVGRHKFTRHGRRAEFSTFQR